MAAKIKLKRVGKRHQPTYRIVVLDHRKSPSSGDCLDNLGIYNPMVKPTVLKVDAEKAKKWLKNGALPTQTVAKLLKKANIV